MRRFARFGSQWLVLPVVSDLRVGAIAGLAGGLAMLVAGLLLSLASGQSIWLPLRCIAALVLGAAAMADTGVGLAPVAVGTAIHLLTAVLFGILFRLLCQRIGHPPTRAGVPLLVGLAYGLLLWLIAIVCIVPRLDTWLAEIAPLSFFLQHLVFGAVLGLICPPKADHVNDAWPVALRGPQRDEAIADLRAILVRRLRATLTDRVPGDSDALIEDVAQEALLQILHSLDTFRGESRFTTWAHTIAAHLARSELRRRRWRDVSLQHLLAQGDEQPGAALLHAPCGPEQQIVRRTLLELLNRLLNEELTPRQRQALLAVTAGGMPMEDIAQHLGTNRNALYKLLHDARQRLCKRLHAEGLSPQEILAAWSDH
jgi:RNA polymerase sigma-70 factor (ECF subfamily)